ncbi:unnamed protein product [Arabis nemorensis]|uniref:Uncharacterized protein n=1 Tax=Arabis nemorensis TaxID=586526 RepID=A0A565AXK5_9BRAS|nr:unnamed protein product [Arabis nemorensis]
MVDSSLDMTLDEIVKRSKTARSAAKGTSRRGRGRGPIVGAGRGAGPVRRGPLAVNARQSTFTINKASSKIWDALLCV